MGRRRAGRRRMGSKRGCEATGLKWDFLLFIYLAELIAQGCLLAFLLYALWPQCPLPPPPAVFLMRAYLQVQIPYVPAHLHRCYVCVCTFWVRVCVYVSVKEHFVPAIIAGVFWNQGLSWCLGMNGIFWDVSVLLCVCQTDMLRIYCTHKKKQRLPGCLLSTMPANSSDYAGHCRMRTRAGLSYFFFCYKFTDICTEHTKINIFICEAMRIYSNAEGFLWVYDLRSWRVMSSHAQSLCSLECRWSNRRVLERGCWQVQLVSSLISFIQETSLVSEPVEKMILQDQKYMDAPPNNATCSAIASTHSTLECNSNTSIPVFLDSWLRPT